MNTAPITPTIHGEKDLSPGQARYWRALARKLAGIVDVVDPWRTTIAGLNESYPPGTRVYRASTGGRWGKSSEVRVLAVRQ